MKLSVILISAVAAIVAATPVDNGLTFDNALAGADNFTVSNDFTLRECKEPARTDGECHKCQKAWEACMKEWKCPGEPGGCASRCRCRIQGIQGCQWPCKWFCC
ncbi:uncharacterized protein EI97DRAFT_443816 [Westerdykella ornata]|uniref:Uncharacterized protein n=1 Tax=Westerdykella ornata TaxID=318751 RepID=A0A6A6JG69_WESOR|nr:uncharacterized protein EI97DRAFT_443816 [Westerdykella ornata]KAF2274626.1 hypothetical protein EI97DRAFT_443816 [Westerdykella ornata]